MMRVKPPKVFAWVQDSESPYFIDYGLEFLGGKTYLVSEVDPYYRRELTDEVRAELGFRRVETDASKIDRLEWDVEMLEERLFLAGDQFYGPDRLDRD